MENRHDLKHLLRLGFIVGVTRCATHTAKLAPLRKLRPQKPLPATFTYNLAEGKLVKLCRIGRGKPEITLQQLKRHLVGELERLDGRCPQMPCEASIAQSQVRAAGIESLLQLGGGTLERCQVQSHCSASSLIILSPRLFHVLTEVELLKAASTTSP